MQVLVLAVQNAVGYEELGVATSGATLFRSMGGTIGVSIFGAIFTSELTRNLAHNFPGGAPPGIGRPVPEIIDKLPPAIHEPYIAAYAEALHPVFLAAAGISVFAFVLTWFLKELPLRKTVGDQQIDAAFLADLFAAPRDQSSLDELANKLSLLARHENRHWVYEALAERAEADLTPQQVWLLFRVRDEETAALPDMEARVGDDRERLTPEMRDLIARNLVHLEGADQGEDQIVFHTTPLSDEMLERIDTVRRKALNDALAGWAPEKHPELIALTDRLSTALADAAP
jgi:predicted MarR family transcription regulator